MISSDFSSQLTVLSRTLSAWAVQMNVSLFSSMMLRTAPVCESTSISRNRWWPRSIFSKGEMVPVLVPAQPR